MPKRTDLADGYMGVVASMYSFTNRLAMATGMLPNREYHGLAR